MNWYRESQAGNIVFLGGDNTYFVKFQIGDRYYGYWLSFPEWVDKVVYIAARSPGKALNFAKKKKSRAYELERDEEYPYDLRIVREIGE